MYNKKRSFGGSKQAGPRRQGAGRKKGGFKGGGNFRRNSGKKNKKELDHSLFIQKAKPIKETEYISKRSYSDMNLHARLKSGLGTIGFKLPTEVQDRTLDESLEGQNILGIANTGTGKTGAFLIPIINKILTSRPTTVQALVVLPTRELAIQVEKDFMTLTKGMRLFSICLYGGSSAWRNVKRLKMFNHVIIGTPGRIIDMVKRGSLDLSNIDVWVLDEFDRMLDMGFVSDMRFMKEKLTNVSQTMLFSATLEKKLKPIMDEIIEKPFEVLVNSGLKSSENVEQNIVKLKAGENKFDKLFEMLKKDDFKKIIIFAETKRTVDMVNSNLIELGIKSECIHGDKDQRARERSLNNFKKGFAKVLVATDVAARGLDVKGITHVINFDTPTDYDSYIHRIGRTGRAGKTGHALTFVK